MSEILQQPQQNKGVLRISLIVLIMSLYIAHKVLPVVGYYTPAIIRMGMCGLLFILLLPLFRRKVAWTMLGIFVISGLNILTRLVRGGELVLYTYGELQIYLYGLIALRFVAKGNRKACWNMFLCILGMYLITAVTTIIGNNNHPQASRALAAISSIDIPYDMYMKQNIGSFSFAYELVLLTPMVIYMTRQKEINPILGYGMLVLMGYCIVMMEYGLAVILFFVSLLLLVLPKLTTKRLLVILLVILLVFLLFSGWLADMFETISEAIANEALADRLMSVAETLRGEEDISSESAASRVELYTMAWRAFWDTSFVGAWGSINTGGHSYILGLMGDYGLIGLAGLAIMLLTIHKICLRPFRGYDFHPYLLWTCLIAVFMMVMNPKAYEFIFLCVLPLFGHGLMTDERRIQSYESTLDRK